MKKIENICFKSCKMAERESNSLGIVQEYTSQDDVVFVILAPNTDHIFGKEIYYDFEYEVRFGMNIISAKNLDFNKRHVF